MTPSELKKWRKKNGYSQAGLADVLGIASLTVARWEWGARAKIPPYLHLALWAMERKGGELRSKKGTKINYYNYDKRGKASR